MDGPIDAIEHSTYELTQPTHALIYTIVKAVNNSSDLMNASIIKRVPLASATGS